MQTKSYPRNSAPSDATSLGLILASLLCVMLAITGCSENTPPATAPETIAVTEAASTEQDVGSPEIVLADERDQYSKLPDVLAFSGVEEGSVVVDVGAGKGYNTSRILPVVGTTGKVYAVGGNADLQSRISTGDLAGTGNVVITEDAAAVPDGVADVVLLIREFHLAPDHPAYLQNVHRMLKAHGRATVVEVRSGKTHGYDHTSHRSGEQTIIDEFEEGGFEYVGASDVLRRDGDDYTEYAPTGKRYMTDRMLLLFRKI